MGYQAGRDGAGGEYFKYPKDPENFPLLVFTQRWIWEERHQLHLEASDTQKVYVEPATGNGHILPLSTGKMQRRLKDRERGSKVRTLGDKTSSGLPGGLT